MCLLTKTAESISTEWTVAHQFETEGNTKMALHCWKGMSDILTGMFNMANYVLGDDDTMELIRELTVIARMHKNRIEYIEYKI